MSSLKKICFDVCPRHKKKYSCKQNKNTGERFLSGGYDKMKGSYCPFTRGNIRWSAICQLCGVEVKKGEVKDSCRYIGQFCDFCKSSLYENVNTRHLWERQVELMTPDAVGSRRCESCNGLAAVHAGSACPVDLEATHEEALSIIPFDLLETHAV